MRELLVKMRRRLWILIPLFTVVTLCFMQATKAGSSLGALPWIIFAISAIVLAALASAFPIAEFLSIPFGRIYFPHVEGKPEPNYTLGEWYLDQHRFEEAFREYDKILHYHPREIVARCLHIELLLAKLDDDQAARRSFRKGMRLAPDPESREHLAKAYAGALQRTVAAV